MFCQMYVIQRSMDQCWYRARILNMMQTTAGPQARYCMEGDIEVSQFVSFQYGYLDEAINI